MAWTYTGDPSSSAKDKYRFLIGDTDETKPILQDGEIEFVIQEYQNHHTRLYHLFTAAALFFARMIRRKVGPIEEYPLERRRYYESQAKYYKMYVSSAGLSLPKSAPIIFTKGMHDNGTV